MTETTEDERPECEPPEHTGSVCCAGMCCEDCCLCGEEFCTPI